MVEDEVDGTVVGKVRRTDVVETLLGTAWEDAKILKYSNARTDRTENCAILNEGRQWTEKS